MFKSSEKIFLYEQSFVWVILIIINEMEQYYC